MLFKIAFIFLQMNTKFIISKDAWTEISSKAIEDRDNTNVLNVPGSCGKVFQKEIRVIENSSVNLNVKHARIYINSKKKDTNYFKCDAVCSISKVKYAITIKNKVDIEENYVNVHVNRMGEHLDHTALEKDKKKEIRGADREKVIQDLKNSGQSVKNFRFEMIANGIENVPAEGTLRQMQYEDRHKFDLYKDWRDNLIATSITSQTHLIGNFFIELSYKIHLIFFIFVGKHFSGFVRRTVVEQDFAMMLHSEKQVDILKCLPVKYRIIRIDATGNLVNVPQYKRNYPRILSYFLQLKDLRDMGKNLAFNLLIYFDILFIFKFEISI